MYNFDYSRRHVTIVMNVKERENKRLNHGMIRGAL